MENTIFISKSPFRVNKGIHISIINKINLPPLRKKETVTCLVRDERKKTFTTIYRVFFLNDGHELKGEMTSVNSVNLTEKFRNSNFGAMGHLNAAQYGQSDVTICRDRTSFTVMLLHNLLHLAP